MTPEQLAPYEPAARIYCKLAGMDPDEPQGRQHPVIVGQILTYPLWHDVAEQLIDLSRMLTAIKVGTAPPEVEH